MIQYPKKSANPINNNKVYIITCPFSKYGKDFGNPLSAIAWLLSFNKGIFKKSLLYGANKDGFKEVWLCSYFSQQVVSYLSYKKDEIEVVDQYILAKGYVNVNDTSDNVSDDLYPDIKDLKEDYKFSTSIYNNTRFINNGGTILDIYKEPSKDSPKGWNIEEDFFKALYESYNYVNTNVLNKDIIRSAFPIEDDNKTIHDGKGTLNNEIENFYNKYEDYIKPMIEYMKKNSIGIPLPEPSPNYHHNIILSGAPGTGKSYIVQNNIVPKILEKNGKENLDKPFVERITFTSSTSYEDFFGCYKPTPDKTTSPHTITYKFIPGVFSKILKSAFEDTNNNKYVLVIEEINRADVYDVFGQIFQLLDRKDTNESEYDISIPEDAKDYFSFLSGKSEKIIIPPNLFIVCTMNAADQGVRLLDTAFKRRFSMVYVDIEGYIYASSKIPFSPNTTKLVLNKNIISKNQYDIIRNNINKTLRFEDMAEDKLIAEHFIKVSDKGIEDIDFIVNILGYLLQNVYRTNAASDDIFIIDEDRQLSLYGILKTYRETGKIEETILNSNLFSE